MLSTFHGRSGTNVASVPNPQPGIPLTSTSEMFPVLAALRFSGIGINSPSMGATGLHGGLPPTGVSTIIGGSSMAPIPHLIQPHPPAFPARLHLGAVGILPAPPYEGAMLRPTSRPCNSQSSVIVSSQTDSDILTTGESRKTENESPACVWAEHRTKDGRIFWHNPMTSKSTWDKPDELKTDKEKLLSIQTPWKEYTSADGRAYWYNTETKQSVWNMPEEVKRIKEQAEEKWSIFETKSEAREKLNVLFQQRGVSLRTKWEDAFKSVHQDSRFGCFSILATGEKKQVFTEYVTQIKRKAREDERANRIRAREQLVEVLAGWKELTPVTRYRDFSEKCHAEPWWNHLEERERDDLFQDFMDDFERKDREEKRHYRQGYIDELIKRFSLSIDITFEMSWVEVQDILKRDPLDSRMDALDILTAWEAFVYDAEKSDRENRKRQVYRIQRKRRDALIKLFEDAAAAGDLHLKTDWVDFMQRYDLAHDSRYLDVIGQLGATPRELMEEVLEHVSLDYEEQKSLIKRTVRRAGIHMGPDSTFEWFYASLRPLEVLPSISECNARIAFGHLQRKALKQARRLGRERSTSKSGRYRSCSRSRSRHRGTRNNEIAQEGV